MIDLLQSEVERRVSGHWQRGRGGSWAREKDGCRVVLYGAQDEGAYRGVLVLAEEIHAAVLRAEPMARVRSFTLIDGETGVRSVVIVVRVSADDLAVFDGGPIHRVAVSRASFAASQAMRSVE